MIWNPGIEVGYDTGTLEWKLSMLPEPWNGNWICYQNPEMEIEYPNGTLESDLDMQVELWN